MNKHGSYKNGGPGVKKKILKIQAKITKLQADIKILQCSCNHPKYEKGLSMMGCIQEVWMCTECGNVKPLRGDWFSEDPNG